MMWEEFIFFSCVADGTASWCASERKRKASHGHCGAVLGNDCLVSSVYSASSERCVGVCSELLCIMTYVLVRGCSLVVGTWLFLGTWLCCALLYDLIGNAEIAGVHNELSSGFMQTVAHRFDGFIHTGPL